MLNRYLTYYMPGVQLLVFFVLFAISGIFISSILGEIVFSYFSNGVAYDKATLAINLKNEHVILSLKYVQIISQIFIFFIPAILFAYLAYPNANTYLHNKTSLAPKFILYGVLLLLCSIPFMGFLEMLNKQIPLPKLFVEVEETANQITNAFIHHKKNGGTLLNILMLCILAPIGEELFFRGVFQNILNSHWYKNTPWIGILISAAFFSLFHFQMQGFFPRFFAGIILGLAFHFSANIWLSIIMHALHNSLALIFIYMQQSTGFNTDAQLMQWYSVAFAVPVVYLIFVFYKQRVPYPIYKVDTDDKDISFIKNKF